MHADAVEALSKWLEGRDNMNGEGEIDRGVSGAWKLTRQGGGRGGEGGAAVAKGLVQLGDAYRKLGQVCEGGHQK